MGATLSAIIRIRNFTNSEIISIRAYDIDHFDFGNFRPDKVFNGISIPTYGSVEKTIDFSAFSSNCPFTMMFEFKNGTKDVFRANYKTIFDGTEAKFQHLTQTHILRLNKTGPRVLEVIIENTEAQVRNQNAEKLMKDGCKLMERGNYSEASMKFMEAAQKANEDNTILNLHKYNQQLKSIKETVDIDKRAKTLNNEGLQLMKNMKLNDALKKFEEGLYLAKNSDTLNLIEDNLKIAKDAKLDQDAKKLNQEGLILRKNKQNEAAIFKFDEAINRAVDPTLLNSIRRNKAKTLSIEAEQALKKAWSLEMSSPEESIHFFAKAKFLYQEADSVKHDLHYQQSVSSLECKIEGDQHYTAGVQLENEGSRLIFNSMKSEMAGDCKTAKDKYDEAWKHYKVALKKFEEGRKKGDVNFDRSLALTREALHGIEKILNELEKAELENVVASA